MLESISKMYLDFLDRERNILIGLAIYFTFCLVFPLITQPTNAFAIIFRGTVLSVLYAVLALGFSLIYGVAKQLKLSIGGYYVIAAYSMYFLLEVIQIRIAFNFDGIDGIVLLFLALFPIIPILIIYSYYFVKLERKYSLIIIISTFCGLGGIFLFSGNLIYALYTGLALTVLSGTFLYLEFPIQKYSLLVLGTSVLTPLLFFVGVPIVYLSLMLLSIIITSIVAILSDRFLLDKFRKSSINIMIITFSLALILQSFVQILYFPKNGTTLEQFGSGRRTLQGIVPVTSSITIFETQIQTIRLISLIFSIVIVIGLYAFIWFSKTGVALRAVSQDEEAASLVGINVRKITGIVSGIGMGLIGFGAVMTAPFAARPWFFPFMGWSVLIFAIAVVTLGGMGSLIGSVIAAFIIGYTEVLVSTIDPSLSLVVPFAIIILVMIVRPEGLFGEKEELA
ncbi:MAG: branched-chain amino acid ABC transporter permease, partial [Candidatus Neomarinimicrobiota bacterium]